MSKEVIAVLVFDFFIVAIPVLLYLYPPKDINGLLGYRTGRSMKSIENWTFSQKYFAKRWMIVPVIVVITQITFVISGSIDLSVGTDDEEAPPILPIISIVEFTVGTLFCIIDTELQLKKNENGIQP